MFSWRLEVSACRSGGTERGDYPESRIELIGCGMGPGNGTLAVSRNRCRLTRDRLEHASEFGPRVENGQYLSFARAFCW